MGRSRCADTTTGVSKPKAGGSTSQNPGFLTGRTPVERTYTTPTEYAL